MKTIMIDMDDVITLGNFERELEKYLGYKPDYENYNNFYLQDLLGDKKEEFFKKFKKVNLYTEAKLNKDCYKVLKKLSKYYNIYICTDYIWRELVPYAGDNLKNKYNFLYKELDFIPPRNFIFAADKSVINCDIKIDDKVNNLYPADTKLLFTAWHNKNIPNEELVKEGIIRVNNFKEIEKLLLNGVEN